MLENLANPRPARDRSSYFVAIWFTVDAAIFLFPPFYWVTNASRAQIFGVPLNLLYFVIGCICITCSVVAAYLVDPQRRSR